MFVSNIQKDKIMNKIYKILFSSVATLAVFASCVKEEYQASEAEVDNYGVYFESLDPARKSVEFDPAEEAVLTFKAFRQKKDGDITVPLKLTATIETKEGIEEVKTVFAVGELFFEDGQEESEFKVEFPNALMGTTYSVAVECTDREYVRIYSDKPTSIAFDVTRVKWNRLVGKGGEEYGTWTDDIVAPAFGMPNYVNDRVEMYEREDKPGYYRMKDAYGTRMVYFFFGEQYPEDELLENTTPGTYTYIDATNPDKVYILWGTSGTTLGSDGEIWFGSFCKENGFKEGKSYGTLSNGVIKFPKDGIVIGFDDEPYAAISSEKNTIVLPGYKDFDYSVQAVTGQSKDGKLPVKVVLGADVATAKYAVYEGPVSSGDVSVKALEISRDEAAKTITESSVIEIECEETGVYTVVFATMDTEGSLKSSTAARFSYVKAGDTVPVVVSAGIGSAERYVGQNYNTDNTVEVWCYGQDLVSVKIGVVKNIEWLSSPDECVKKVNGMAAVSAEVLEQINGGGYAAPVSKLLPGTGYKAVIIASNGYETKVLVPDAVVTTTGDPLPVYNEFTVDSIKEELLPEKSEGYFGKYNFYAVDKKKKVGLREYISKVTIADSELKDSEPNEDGLIDEYMDFSGMFSRDLTEDEKFDDTMVWDFYDGLIYSVSQKLGQYSDYWLFPYTSEKARGPLPLEYDALLIGGFVDDGYIAIMGNPGYAENGLDFNGIAMVAYGDKEYSSPVKALLWYTDLLLVEESKDDNGLAPSPAVTASLDRLHAVSDLSKTMKFNYVETPKGRVRSMIDASKRQIKFYAPEEGVIFSKPATTASYTATVVPGVQGDFSNNFSKGKSLKAELDALPAVVR